MRAPLFVLLAGCGAPAPEPTPDTATAHNGIGEACRDDGDCIQGAACSLYTCDFVGPCESIVTIRFLPSIVTQDYRYDDAGRSLGSIVVYNGNVNSHYAKSWSPDGRFMIETVVSEGIAASFSETRDARGVVTRTSNRGTETITHSKSWSCRADTVVMHGPDGKLLYTSRPTCTADGAPATIDSRDPDGKLVGHTMYDIEDGRIVREQARKTNELVACHNYRRDGHGAVIAHQLDLGCDGVVDYEESSDLSCWVVDGDRVRYRPK